MSDLEDTYPWFDYGPSEEEIEEELNSLKEIKMIQEVVEILDPQIKTGVGQKGEWSQAKVKLKNGEIAYIFQPIEVGDMVEAFQNGQYTNWKIVKEPAKRGFSSSPPNPKITTTTGFTQADRDLLVEIHAQIIGPGAYDD